MGAARKLTCQRLAQIASDYAKRLEKELDIALKVPEEWDFREVTKQNLLEVLEWEYSREKESIRRPAAIWLDRIICGTSIRERLLNGEDPLQQPDLPETEESLTPVFLSPLFPVPWLAFEKESGEHSHNAEKLPSVWICRYTDWPFTKPMLKEDGTYIMHIDFRRGIMRAKQDITKWLHRESKRLGISKRGKASTPPFQKLKWLAALRLHKAGLGYAKAQDFIRQHVAKVKSANPFDVLPTYSSPGAWHDAVKDGKTEVSHFHPLPPQSLISPNTRSFSEKRLRS